MRIFVLEDDPTRIGRFLEELGEAGHDLTVCTDVESGLRNFNPPYDLMLLDHDLGGEVYAPSDGPNTGYTFVQQLPVMKGIAGTVVVIHSFNYEGAKRMHQSAARSGARAVMRIPFGDPLFAVVRRMIEVWEKAEKEGVCESSAAGAEGGGTTSPSSIG